MNKQTSPKYAKVEPLESDPYSPMIVQELLQGSTEWLHIQDIVKLTFKAMLDVMKAHSEAIKELERVVPSKASKSELASGLAQKASVADVSKTVAEVAANIESRATVEEVQQLLESRVSKTDFQYAISNKVSIDEMRNALESKVGIADLGNDIKLIQKKVEDTQKELQYKIAAMASAKEMEDLKRMLELKANAKEVTEGLAAKANKESVASALNRKANREDMNAILAKKTEAADLQKVVESLEKKANTSEFEEMCKKLMEKEEAFAEMSKMIDQKANVKDIEASITEAVSLQKMELEKKLIEVEKQINALRKSVHDELETIEKTTSRKVDATEIDQIKSVIEKKPDVQAMAEHLVELKRGLASDLELVKSQFESSKKKIEEGVKQELSTTISKLETAQHEISKLKEHTKTITEERRKESEETNRYLKTISGSSKLERQEEQRELQKEIATLRKEIEFLGQKKCERKELLEVKNSLAGQIEAKTNIDEVQKAISEMKTDAAHRIIEVNESFAKRVQGLEEDVYTQLSQKANSRDIESALEQKVEKVEVFQAIEQKGSAEDIGLMKSKLTAIQSEMQKKADAKELDTHVIYTKGNIEEIKREILLKANIKDVCTLVDSKANVDDVNKALESVNKELGKKPNAEELQSALSDQAVINETLCAENCAGRWMWKSGVVKSGYAVPWELESVNTCPDNFLWEKDKISVLTVAPGLYEISMGFFSSKKPAVQLLVNGEPVLSPVNSASYVIQHSTGKIKSTGKHVSGNITGLTLVDFIALPPRARISISYNGEPGAEGFLGLRRL